MIVYKTRHTTRNEEAMEQLRGLAAQRKSARRVHECAESFISALQCLQGGNWVCNIDFDAGYVSFSRDWS